MIIDDVPFSEKRYNAKPADKKLSFESDNYPFLILPNVAVAADLLKCSPHELVIIEDALSIYNYQWDRSLRDKFIEARPLVQFPCFMAGSWRYGHETTKLRGVSLFRTRADVLPPAIDYVIINVTDMSSQAYCIVTVCKRSDRLKLRQYAKAQTQKYQNAVAPNPPILSDDILKAIEKNVFGFLARVGEFKRFDVKATKGIMFYGKPGNGKSFTMNYIMRRLPNTKANFITTTSLLSCIANNNNPFLAPLVFVDDVDGALLTKEHSDATSTLLSWLDGSPAQIASVRIFSSNSTQDIVAKAFIRSGRIDEWYEFPDPSPAMRKKYIEKTFKQEIVKCINVDKAVKITEGLTFADLASIKQILVVNKIVDKCDWDFDLAFAEFSKRQKTKKKATRSKNSVGFAEEIKADLPEPNSNIDPDTGELYQ